MKVTDQGLIGRFSSAAIKETTNPLADLPAMTPVENISCPVLLIYGTEDLNMDAELTSGYILDQLKAAGKESLCTVLQLPGAGHIIDPPHSPLFYSTYMYINQSKMFIFVWVGKPSLMQWGR